MDGLDEGWRMQFVPTPTIAPRSAIKPGPGCVRRWDFKIMRYQSWHGVVVAALLGAISGAAGVLGLPVVPGVVVVQPGQGLEVDHLSGYDWKLFPCPVRPSPGPISPSE